MRLVIYGSRSLWPTCCDIDAAVLGRWGGLPSMVISGAARGADTAGEKWAKWHDIQCRRMPADWDRWGKKAGRVRNTGMAELCTHGLGFWDGQSRGTRHMTSELVRLGRPHCVKVVGCL